MSRETKTQDDSTALKHVRKAIDNPLASQLDTFSEVQHTFFDVCQAYAQDCSSDTHWDLEQSAVLLEFSAIETMQAIAASQGHVTDKIRMVQAFTVAEDVMRIETFRRLAPHATFVSLREGGVESFDANVRDLLLTVGFETALTGLVTATQKFIRDDTAHFSEAIATGVDVVE